MTRSSVGEVTAHACRPAWRPRWRGVLSLLVLAMVGLHDPALGGESGVHRPGGRVWPSERVERVRCLYNGYLLTVDPAAAMAPASSADRYRLYVLHAVLVDPDSGRVAAIFPALGTPAFANGPVAHPAVDYQALQAEQPPAPGITSAQLRAYWLRAGVEPALLADAEWVDLEGAVATPGLTDTHFHLSSWCKKVPAPGERLGYWGDLSDPAYYVIPGAWTRTCARDAMWHIVADANHHLVETGDDGVLLHGYVLTEMDSGPDGQARAAYLFASSPPDSVSYNPDYLPNRIGAREVSRPADPCTAGSDTWPALDYPTVAALVVQTTGQSSWYNSTLLEAYNQRQQLVGAALAPVPLSGVASLGSNSWRLTVAADATGADPLFTARPPFSVDVVVTTDAGVSLTVPFDVVASDPAGRTLTADAMIPELAAEGLSGSPSGLELRPFYRPIVDHIPATAWQDAADFWGETADADPVAYGAWDPREPYATNWYNGAKRGLVQYFFDADGQTWRPTGYAEHYPMRDALMAVLIEVPTVAQLMEMRRNTAAWCHRHGLTMVNDIMFYRRRNGGGEFESYEALSYDHGADGAFHDRVGLDRGAETGGLYLRVGMYYYIETGDDVAESLALAHAASAGSDVDRLQPAVTHPEYPGWVRWLGWKLQLDGSAATRNAFTSAPLAKIQRTDPVTVANEYGNQVTFNDHSFGLLTMTDLQEQVFSSRESAALYWVVRESDPSSAFFNPAMDRNWSALASGVVNFVGIAVNTSLLAADLVRLSHVTLSPSQAEQLAGKVAAVLAEVNDGWERTLSAIIRIWYERSRSPEGLPPLPAQTVCHTSGDGAVALWARAIRQLEQDVASLPTRWADLPERWRQVIPEDADLTAVRRVFSDERFRMEHLTIISGHLLEEIQGEGGIDADTTMLNRNALVSLQPAILLLDGGTGSGFPVAQELWPLQSGATDPWQGLPAMPRFQHSDALTTFVERDIPMTINTDPPAMRDPRPALTVLGAVARTPVEIDPERWADQSGPEPPIRPPDYLAGKVYPPFGLVEGSATNPMQLTIEQALAAMTFWGAYSAGMEREVGALDVPDQPGQAGQEGWFADVVVWRANPLAITGADGLDLEQLGRMPAGSDDEARLATVNAFIEGFLPSMTVVAGVPVYRREGGE